MKSRMLGLAATALLLSSSYALADGRPTGIRIGSVTQNPGTSEIEIQITVPNTDILYAGGTATTLRLRPSLDPRVNSPFTFPVFQFASGANNVRLPYAIDWGDGSLQLYATLSGPAGGPFTGTFTHTYPETGFLITVGDAVCCEFPPLQPPSQKTDKGGGLTITTGYGIYGNPRYLSTFGGAQTTFFYIKTSPTLAITNTALVELVGPVIPTLNVFGLLAMALVLLGSGVLLYRKPRRFAG